MLDQLPPEIIEQILGHLPTASAIVNVSCVNKKLHGITSANDHAIFRAFVQKAFPSIQTPPLWRTMACSLTSRSRAWNRRALIGRECVFPQAENAEHKRSHPGPGPGQFFYFPVIDSYEEWSNPVTGHDQKREVLAIGAAGRLQLRVRQSGKTRWSAFSTSGDHLPRNDISDVRLLRPQQKSNECGELVLLRRGGCKVDLVQQLPEQSSFTYLRSFVSDKGTDVDCIDVGLQSDPLLALCSSRSIQLFRIHEQRLPSSQEGEDSLGPRDVLPLVQNLNQVHRYRCTKFLSDERLAIGVQFLEGRDRAPVLIYDVTPTGLVNQPLDVQQSLSAGESSPKGRHSANVISPLDATSTLTNRPGQVFLSGWTDGITRLHDIRCPSQPVQEYVDHVDDGQISSLISVGHEQFIAGSHQNACLKIFDMRMNARRYFGFEDIVQSHNVRRAAKTSAPSWASQSGGSRKEREVNIFLAVRVNPRARPWQGLPRNQSNDSRNPRYGGSIYSLSSPSPSSSTIYAGIRSHVIQLDFANTGDIKLNRSNMFGGILDNRPILDLSCYERPRRGHESTDTVLLRKQAEWGSPRPHQGQVEAGWDERWRLPRSRSSLVTS